MKILLKISVLPIYLFIHTYILLTIYLFIYLWLYSPWLDFGRFFSSVSESYTQSVGLLERGISPSQGRYLHTEQHRE
jgi:hypothetical protein